MNSFSVIIPFRNEEKYLPELLKSILKLDFPKKSFELLFVDDDSTDNSVAIIHNYLKNSNLNYQILANKRRSKSPKKDALETAILKSKFDYIVTTDADCILPKLWLSEYDCFLQKGNSSLIAAPIQLIYNNSFIQKLQALEILSLQTATIGGFGWKFPFLANGGNLCFKKSDFKDVKGFDGNNNIASGDDIFLLEKFLLHKKKVSFLKSDQSIVKTHPELNWEKVISQRVRWASKSKNYRLKRAKIIGLIVFLMNAALVLGFPFVISEFLEIKTYMLFVGSKLGMDFLSMIVQLKREKKINLFFSFLVSSLVYPLLSIWITLKSFSGNYRWKEREFKV